MNYAAVSHLAPRVDADGGPPDVFSLIWETDGEHSQARQETWLLSFIDILALLLTLFVLLLAIQDRGAPETGDKMPLVEQSAAENFTLLGGIGGSLGPAEAAAPGFAMSGAGLIPTAGLGGAVAPGDTPAIDRSTVRSSFAAPDIERQATAKPGTSMGAEHAKTRQATVAAHDEVDAAALAAGTSNWDVDVLASASPSLVANVPQPSEPLPSLQVPADGVVRIETPTAAPSPAHSAVAEPSPPDLAVAPIAGEKVVTRQAAETLRQRLNDSALGAGVDVLVRPGAVNLEISDSILFTPASAALSSQGVELLQQLAAILKTLPYHVSVEGHTDNVPIHTAQYPSNWELSAARAALVTRKLIEQGVASDRLRAIGYGATRPRVDNLTREARAKNRRVTFVLQVEQGR